MKIFIYNKFAYINMDKFESLKLQLEKILDSDKTVLIFIRHGETEANFTKQLSGWHDVKLTE